MKVKTTLYLDRDMKRAVERAAKERRCSEADIIRAAIAKEVAVDERPLPRFGLFWGPTDLSERVDEILADGFGED